MEGPRWIFDPAPPSGARQGGLAMAQVIDPALDNFVREVIQNAMDRAVSSAPVKVVFTLRRVTGPGADEVLKALGWDNLKPHVQAAADAANVVMKSQLDGALAAAKKKDFMVLRIDDAGTEGLTGGEDDGTGNFSLLTRHTLVTSEDDKLRGGSFGLGKSVLWRFSLFSTVLFASLIPASSEGLRMRVIGRSELPYHDLSAGDDFNGPGWFGDPEGTARGLRAVSLWDAEAERYASELNLSREHLGRGTSILIPGFFEPERERDDGKSLDHADADELIEKFAASAARWYWPSIAPGRKKLNVLVGVGEDDEEVEHEVVGASPAEAPFVDAAEARSLDAELQLPGDVGGREIGIKLPSRRTEALGRNISTTVSLRLRLSGAAESADNAGTIALIRGAGMVVKYLRPSISVEQPFHGVLLAGFARGESDADKALEEFLRAAEPPSHNEWKGGTPRLQADYRSGAYQALSSLWTQINEAVAQLCGEVASTSGEGPRRLMDLMQIKGRGGGFVAPQDFRVEALKAELDGNEWVVSGRIKALLDARWKASVRLVTFPETGRGDSLPLTTFSADSDTSLDAGAGWIVPTASQSVRFSGKAVVGGEDLDIGATRVKLEVRPVREGSN